MKKTELKFTDNGPILLTGEWALLDSNGKVLASNEDKPVALCRCGEAPRSHIAMELTERSGSSRSSASHK